MNIEDLGVDTKCLAELRRVGFTEVEEIVEWLEDQVQGRAMIRAGWMKCFSDVVKRLKHYGFWSDELEQAWPSQIFE
jgi:hypothetical protein